MTLVLAALMMVALLACVAFAVDIGYLCLVRTQAQVAAAGIRVVDIQLTGGNKYILIQPAYVIDPTAIAKSWATESRFVAQPLRLVR